MIAGALSLIASSVQMAHAATWTTTYYVLTDPAAYDSLAQVPVPAAVWLFASGLLGLIGVAKRRAS